MKNIALPSKHKTQLSKNINSRHGSRRALCVRLFAFLLAFFTAFTEGYAAPNFLEKNVSLKANDRRMGEVLQTLAGQVGCRLSYNPEVVDENRRVSLSVAEMRLRDALRQLLGDEFQFRERDEFVTIRKLKAGERVIGGYISDKKTGQKIDKATVYDKKTLRSATTDQYGYYEIVSREPIKELTVGRVNYGDTTFQVKSIRADTPQYADLSLIQNMDFSKKIELEEPDTPVRNLRSDFDKYRERVLLDFKARDLERFANNYTKGFQRSDVDNLQKADLRRGFQWSIVPYGGNNGGLSGSVTNDFALNLTVGYSKGNRILEIGGIGNVNRGLVSGIQVGSLFNLSGESRSLQIAGLLNRAKILRGVQISGLTNTSRNFKSGLQIAGINNFASRGGGGIQIAGIVNDVNHGKTMAQFSGIANTADTVGLQVGLVNKAGYLKGLQFGLINICDTSSGVVLGLINSVKRGYNTVEISTFDGKLANVAFKTGTSWFYTSYIGSMRTDSTFFNNQTWGIGMGFGTNIRLTKRFGFTLDLTGQHFSIGTFNPKWWSSEMVRLSPAITCRLGKRLQVFGGGSYNWLLTDSDKLTLEQIADFRQRLTPTEGVKTSVNWQKWGGWYAGVRFF